MIFVWIKLRFFTVCLWEAFDLQWLYFNIFIQIIFSDIVIVDVTIFQPNATILALRNCWVERVDDLLF